MSDPLNQGSSFFHIPDDFHLSPPTAADLDDLNEILSFNPLENADQIDFFPHGSLQQHHSNFPEAANGHLQDLDDPVFGHPAPLDFDQFLHDEADVPHQAPEPTAQPQPLYGAVS